MKLYKYYPPVEYAFKSLENQTVCFNSMANFEDKLEGHYKMVARPEPTETQLDKIINGAMISLADRMSEEYTDMIRFRFRILSVTDSDRYEYMWREYAKGGSGFCLEYESNELEKCSQAWGRINYKGAKEPDGIFQDSTENVAALDKRVQDILFMKKLGFGKGEDYRQEHEIRYVIEVPRDMVHETDIEDYMNNHLGYPKDKDYTYYAEFLSRKHFKAKNLVFRKARVSRVIIGQQMSKNDSDRIENIADKLGISISKNKENGLL